jgi:antitoxin StbD
MTRLLTPNIATMTEMREPQKVLERANGEPVAILKNSAVVAYLVPADAISAPQDHRVATREEVLAHLTESRERVQPVLDYLKDT